MNQDVTGSVADGKEGSTGTIGGTPYVVDKDGEKWFAPRPSTQLIVHREDWNLLEKIKNIAESLLERQESGSSGWQCRDALRRNLAELKALRSIKTALPTVQLAKFEHEVEEQPNAE